MNRTIIHNELYNITTMLVAYGKYVFSMQHKLKYIEFDQHIDNCADLVRKLSDSDLEELFFDFTKKIDTTDVSEIVEVIFNKFVMIIALDKLIDKLTGGFGTNAKQMTFSFGPNILVRLHDIDADNPGSIMLIFCDTLQQIDKLVATFYLISDENDLRKSWKDMYIQLKVENLDYPVSLFDLTNWGTFKFSVLENLINKVYRK